MHAAPSVSYPVGRSAFAGGLCAGLAALGVAAVATWSWQVQALGWRQWFALALVIVSAGIGAAGWWRSPRGMLRWDGGGWLWEQGAQAQAGQPELALDLQARLLLRWQGTSGRARWFWLEQASAPADWDALRRAVYSRANAPIPTFPQRGKESLSDGKPPAAEQ